MNATLGKSHLCTKQAVLRLGHIGTPLGKNHLGSNIAIFYENFRL